MKKVLALLLIFIVSGAALTPCCSGTSDCTDEGTALSHQEAGEETGCSPFFSCTTCPGSVSPATLLAAGVATPVYSHYFESEVKDTPIPYYAAHWQPPRKC